MQKLKALLTLIVVAGGSIGAIYGGSFALRSSSLGSQSSAASSVVIDAPVEAPPVVAPTAQEPKKIEAVKPVKPVVAAKKVPCGPKCKRKAKKRKRTK